jgi:hypothetical protein
MFSWAMLENDILSAGPRAVKADVRIRISTSGNVLSVGGGGKRLCFSPSPPTHEEYRQAKLGRTR